MSLRSIIASLYFSLTVLCSGNAVAADESWDDLKDKENPQAYIALGISKQKSTPKIAEKAFQKAYTLANKQGNWLLMAKATLEQAQTAKIHKDYLVAEQYLIKAEFISASLENHAVKVNVFANMSTILRNLKQHKKSYDYIQRALVVAEESNDSNLILKCLQIKARVLQSMKQYDESLSTYLLADRYTSNTSKKNKIKQFRDTAHAYSKVNEYESSVRYYRKALLLLQEMDALEETSVVYMNISQVHAKAGEYSQAIENGVRSLAIAREYQSEKDILKALVGLSVAYRKISSYEDALTHGLEALQIYDKNTDFNGIAASANTIGLIYFYLNQRNKAKEYFTHVLSLPKDEVSTKYRAAALRDKAKLVFTEGELQQALELSNESYNLYGKIGNKRGQASVQTTLGSFYYKMGQIDESINSYNTSINIFQKLKDTWNEASSKGFLAFVLVERDVNKSIVLAQDSLTIATKIGAKSVAEQAYSALILAEEKRGNYQKALAYSKRKEAIINEVKADEISKRSAEMYIILNVEKKERAIALLRKEKSVLALELDNEDSKSKLIEQEKVIKELKAQIALIIVSVCITAIMLALLVVARIYFNMSYGFIISAIFLLVLTFFIVNSSTIETYANFKDNSPQSQSNNKIHIYTRSVQA